MSKILTRESEPVPELTHNESNSVQAELIERFVNRGGTEIDWVDKYAARFRALVESDESIRVLIRRDWQMAMDTIEEALNEN